MQFYLIRKLNRYGFNYENNGNTNEKLSGKFVGGSGSLNYITDTELKSESKFNMFVTKGLTFKVDESNSSELKNYETFVVRNLVQNFKNGTGPENYEFPENGIISSKFLTSDVLKSAVTEFNAGFAVKNKQFSFGLGSLIKDTGRNGTIYSITGLVGSVTITIIRTVEGIKVKIFNITSLTSGTLGKEFFGEESYPKSYVRDPAKTTPYGNISQIFNLFIPSKEVENYVK